MYFNKKDLSLISKLLSDEINSCNLVLTKCRDYASEDELKEIENQFDEFKRLFCKINNIPFDLLDKSYYYINLFRDNGYKYVRAYGINKYNFEEIESISYRTVSTKQGSYIGWDVTYDSCFVDDTFYPYGIDRPDVFLEFKVG